MKPNRKTWILGAVGVEGRIHYPPVVPWIDNTTRDAIIRLFLEVSNTDLSAIQGQIADLEFRIRRLEGKGILTPVEHRQLHQYRKEMTTLQERIEFSRERLVADARSEALNLCLIRGVRQVRVVGEPSKLLIVTAPIAIEKALLGAYDILLDPRQTNPARAIDLVRRDRRHPHGPHPHWNNHPCFGTWGPMLLNMMKRKNWSAVVGAMLNYLARYYAESPLITLEEFYPGGAYANLTPTV